MSLFGMLYSVSFFRIPFGSSLNARRMSQKPMLFLYLSILLSDHPNNNSKLLRYLRHVPFQICWWHWVADLGETSSGRDILVARVSEI